MMIGDEHGRGGGGGRRGLLDLSRRRRGPRIPVPVVGLYRSEIVSEFFVEFSEHASEVANVRVCLEAKISAVGQVLREFVGAAPAELGNFYLLFLLQDQFVFAMCGFGFEALPRQPPFEKVDEDVADGLEVVPPALLDS